MRFLVAGIAGELVITAGPEAVDRSFLTERTKAFGRKVRLAVVILDVVDELIFKRLER
jgi:hypothetical protein